MKMRAEKYFNLLFTHIVLCGRGSHLDERKGVGWERRGNSHGHRLTSRNTPTWSF